MAAVTTTCHTHTANDRVFRGPTNTQDIEQAFIDELRRRMKRVRGLVRRTVGYENDALRLRQDADGPTINAEEQEAFAFISDSGRVQQFISWFKQAIQDEVLGQVGTGVTIAAGDHWTAEFVDRAYVGGWNQATGLLFQQGAQVENIDDADILNLPKPTEQLRKLHGQAYEQLEDITAHAATVMREELTKGLARGENPRKIARRLNQELESVTRDRLETYARTAIVDSHADATLDRYEDAGVDVVSHSEWSTAGDARVCPICRALDGREFTTKEMRDTTFEMEDVSFNVRLKPPAHPNCRCAILPVIGGTAPTTPLSERLPDEPVEPDD